MQHRTTIEERRQQRTNRRRLLEVLGLMVVLVTAYALMMPAISITQDAATQESGFYQAEQAEIQNIATESDSVSGDFAASDAKGSGEPRGVGEQGGAEAADSAEQDDEPANIDEEIVTDDAATGEEAVTEDAAAEEPATGAQDEKPAQDFHEELKDAYGNVTMAVSVKAPKGAFAAGTTMRISEIDAEEVKAEVEAAVQKTSGANTAVKQMAAVDIVFLDAEGNEVEPARQVEVKITSEKVREIDDPVLVHVVDKGKPTQAAKQDDAEVVKKVEVVNEDDADKTVGAEDTLKFKTKEFSPYVIVETETIEANVLASDGNTYTVTVSYGPDANIPAGAELDVREIVQETGASDSATEYEEYVAKTQETLGWEGAPEYARFFDISIMADGAKVQPAKGSFVNVEIRLNDIDLVERPTVVHFADDDAATGEVVESAKEKGGTVSFMTDGFSAYAIVDGPAAVPLGWRKATSLSDLTSEDGFYIGHPNGFYFMNITDGNSTRMGIKKTKPAQSYPKTDAPTNQRPAKYYFEIAGEGTYYAYCYANDGTTKQYVYNGGNNSLAFADADHPKTAFTVSVDSEGKFTFNNGSWFWNMQGGDNGTRFCSYDKANDPNNKMELWYFTEVTSDPYNLNDKTYGLMNWNGGAAGKAMMAESSTVGHLDGKILTVLVELHHAQDKLFVPENTDISMWTFEWFEQDNYYLSTVDEQGSMKYLKVDASGLSLVSEKSEASLIKVAPGSGIHAGEMTLRSGDTTITYSGDIDKGFNVNGNTAGSEWFHLVDYTHDPTQQYIKAYSASKISVSDSSLNGAGMLEETGEKKTIELIVYTRFWDEEKKKYKFYAIDADGSLVPCNESGDAIEWTAGQINTLLWQFTEYTNDGTTKGNPNGYYELYNPSSGNYIAPQVTNGQVLSKEPIGFNLSGRRNGKYYSSILAWEDDEYSYAGLKVQDGQIVSCLSSEAMDFYFATMDELVVDDEMHEVETLDHEQYGITMKIIDITAKTANEERLKMSNFLGNNDGGAVLYTQPGLLSTDLKEDGYPTTNKIKYPNATGNSLSEMYEGAKQVNHLFIESTYRASGYYEFDSAQNFAALKDKNFRVYKELGSYDTGGNKPTLKHGQFLPFNDLEPGVFAEQNGENLYDTAGKLLPDGDPRKHEQLYLVKNVDCYFAVELEASFVQTPSGLDAWGHDIIYEFTGDDDFWLYVDGELVIDLGGIHSALPGSVNFRTGKVNVNGTELTLYDLFYNNYLNRVDEETGQNHTEEQAHAYVDEIFELNAENNYVFKDGTSHTMRIFYMERGGGASNLHMRFNLASIKPGTVLLSKELSGVDKAESIQAEFPYQIFYKLEGDETEYMLTNAPNSEAQNYVYYQDSTYPVPFKEKIKVGGVEYENAFILKPGDVAEVSFPEKGDFGQEQVVSEYRVVECGVNTDVFDSVKVNKTEIQESTEYGNTQTYLENRRDFALDYASTDARPSVPYINKVNPDALRTLTATKRLYDETGLHTAEHEVHDAAALFQFRLYLATEFEGELHESPAYKHSYHVKSPNGKYCTWSSDQWLSDKQGFVESEYESYDDIPAEKKNDFIFETSPNGSINYIPAFYTVEVRDILAGTRYRVEERPWEVPDGYSFQQYENFDNASDPARASVMERVDENGREAQGVDGIVVSKEESTVDPNVDICNLKGWGLRVNKIWSDADYMTAREDTYFAVFTKNGNELNLVPNTVRKMLYGKADTQTLYWYFPTLPYAATSLNDYVIREVMLSENNPDVDTNGVVTNYGEITILDEGDEVKLKGKQKGESDIADFTYTVSYALGTISSDSNVREDTTTNTRPGIVLKKQNWNGNPLGGATFELKDDKGEIVGTFTSESEEGLITVAFLGEGKNYTLIEKSAPQGYFGLQEPLTIRLSNPGGVSVSGADESYYKLQHGQAGITATLIIKNRPFMLKAMKVDGDTEVPLEGVTFALHKMISDGHNTTIDINPMPGYDELVTDGNGVIPGIDSSLPANTYELREVSTLSDYQQLSSNIRFTISPTGEITLEKPCPSDVTLTKTPEDSASGGTSSGDGAGGSGSASGDEAGSGDEQADSGAISYVMTIPNWQEETVSFFKVDIASPTAPLAGATFDLYEYDTTTNALVEPALYTGLTSGSDGLLALGVDANKQTAFKLRVGTYHLIETDAPDGYNLRSEPVVVTVHHSSETASNPVTYDDSTTVSQDGSGISLKDGVYKLTVTNTSGYELPSTGGLGTLPFTIVGGLLVALAAVIFLRRRTA